MSNTDAWPEVFDTANETKTFPCMTQLPQVWHDLCDRSVRWKGRVSWDWVWVSWVWAYDWMSVWWMRRCDGLSVITLSRYHHAVSILVKLSHLSKLSSSYAYFISSILSCTIIKQSLSVTLVASHYSLNAVPIQYYQSVLFPSYQIILSHQAVPILTLWPNQAVPIQY